MTTRSSVETVRLTDGVSIPLIGFGTWQLQGQDAYSGVFDFELTGAEVSRIDGLKA
jgi:hypothetical protein